MRKQPGGNPDFANDDGSPDLTIRSARTSAELLHALGQGRVLVAVVATAEETDEVTGADKSSHMSVVSMRAADGRRGLLAFTGLDALQQWDPHARPVPVSGSDAARAALDDGCEALILDVAGSSSKVVIEADLIALANVDPIQWAQQLTQQAMDDAFGAGEVDVGAAHNRLRVHSTQIPPGELTAILQGLPRVLALVPAGIEVDAGE